MQHVLDFAENIAVVLVAARHATSAGEDCVASAVHGGKASSAESLTLADGVQLGGIAGEVQ